MAIRIAIDINDVVRDYSRQFSECYKKYTGNWNDTPDVTSFDYMECFDFADNDEYVNFRYVDYAFDLSAKAEAMDKMLPYKLNDWLQNTLRDVDEDKIPEVMFVSALESGLTIQATYFFLSKIQTRVREVYFPIDSSTIWDRCDLLITANPKLINSVPDGKRVIMIETPYNVECEPDYKFKSLMDVICDEDEIVLKIVNGEV